MEKFYTLFCATDELHTSPAIQLYSRLHDIVLTLGQQQTITFQLPTYVHSFQHDDVAILYEEDIVDLIHATVLEQQINSRICTNLSITLRPRDVGSTVLGVVTPEAAGVYRYATYLPQFIKNKPISESN